MNLEQIDTSTTAGKAEVMRLAAEGLEYFERAGDAGDRKYVAAIRSALAISQQSGADGLPMVMVSHEFKDQAEYEAEVTSAVANLLRGNQLGISGSQPEMVSALMRIASSPPSAIEALGESEKDVALAQAVEFAEYVERQAKGAMIDAARRFLSLPYAQELAKRLTPPEGYVLVPVEPTDAMKEAGSMWNTEMDEPPEFSALMSIWKDMLAARPEAPNVND